MCSWNCKNYSMFKNINYFSKNKELSIPTLERWDTVWSHLQTRHRHVSTYTRHSQSWCHSRWPFDDVIHEQIKETPTYHTLPLPQRSLHTCTCWSWPMTSYILSTRGKLWSLVIFVNKKHVIETHGIVVNYRIWNIFKSK